MEVWEPDSSKMSHWSSLLKIKNGRSIFDIVFHIPSEFHDDEICQMKVGVLISLLRIASYIAPVALDSTTTATCNNEKNSSCSYISEGLFPCRDPFCMYKCSGSTSPRYAGVPSAEQYSIEQKASQSCIKVSNRLLFRYIVLEINFRFETSRILLFATK